jgi:hypothetical protein
MPRGGDHAFTFEAARGLGALTGRPRLIVHHDEANGLFGADALNASTEATVAKRPNGRRLRECHCDVMESSCTVQILDFFAISRR